MIQVNESIRVHYDKLLKQKKIPEYTYNFYRKWLRYYLDFCVKYQYPESEQESLTAFMLKLQEKKQTVQQKKQAAHAVRIYFELTNTDSEAINITPPAVNNPWADVYTSLKKEIQVRHYSKRTLYDIRTIQQLLGHSDLRTTMIYTHTVPSKTIKEAQSPLDFGIDLGSAESNQ